MSAVEVGQYFVTRNASEFLHTIACREYTPPRDDQASEPKGWIRGNTRIGPILEVTTSFQHFKFGVEVRIQSVNEDNSHSWVRVSYGTVRYVNNYIKYVTQNFADPQEEEDVPTSSGVVAARSKAKAKPQPRESTGTTTIPLSERVWIDIEPSKPDLESYNLSKKVINLLRHNQKLHREEDGAIQFYKIKFHLRDYHLPIQNWSDDRWLAYLAAGGGSKRRYQYCSDYLGSIIYLCALQGHSGSNLIDPTLQDNVLIGPGVFPYTYHVGSNFNISSILSNGLIPGGQNLSRRQSVFFLPVDPRDEDHKDPENIDYSVPRHARYLQNTWTRHQDTVFWIDIDLGIIKEGLKFYQTRSNAIILQGALPANCIERQYLSPRPPPKISLKHDLNWTKENDQGSTVEHQPVGKLVQQSLGETLQFGSCKPTQPNPIGVLQEEPSSSDRPWKPATEEEQHVRNHDKSGKLDREETQHTVQEDCHLKSRDKVDKFDLATDGGNIDFNISGIPDEAVKRSQNINILQLIRRITRHPQQEAVQNDLDKQQSFNAFSNESKVAIMDAGNIEISEIVNVEPKWQCKVCLNHCSTGVIYCVCGRLMTKGSAENRKYISAILDTFSIPNFHIRKNRPHGHRYGQSQGCKEYLTANQLAKKCRKKKYDSIHDRFVCDKTFRKAMIEVGRSEQMIIEMDKLTSEDHTYKASKEEIEFYRGNWWIHTNVAHFDSVPTRYEPEFKSALSTMQRLKRAEDKKKQETLAQTSSSSSSWHWHTSWWESDFEHSPQKWYDH